MPNSLVTPEPSTLAQLLSVRELKAPSRDPKPPPLAEQAALSLIPILIIATIYRVLAVCGSTALSALCM